MLQTLTEADRAWVLDYIAAEPEFNLFLFGDLENYGFSGDPVSVYATENAAGARNGVLLQYYAYFLLYSADPAFDGAETAAFLRERECATLSGKADVVRRVMPYMPDKKLRITYLSRCSRVHDSAVPALPDGAALVRVYADGVPDVMRMLATIDEFASDMETEEDLADEIERTKKELAHGSVQYAVYDHGALAAAASSSGANSQSAMVMAVATLPSFRGRGYASNAVAAVCRDSFAEGRRFLCLFYDNPEAGRMYRKIGFEEIGEYAMLK